MGPCIIRKKNITRLAFNNVKSKDCYFVFDLVKFRIGLRERGRESNGVRNRVQRRIYGVVGASVSVLGWMLEPVSMVIM